MPLPVLVRRHALALILLGATTALSAAETPRLTIYRDTSDALFSATSDGPVESGYAMVSEARTLKLQPGHQTQRIDALPPLLDPQTLSLQDPSKAWILRSSQLLPPPGNPSLALQGQHVDVIGDNGQVLAQGSLLPSRSGLTVKDDQGGIMLIEHYAAIRSTALPATGASLQLDLDARRAGSVPVILGYATRGLGWQALYQAVLTPDERCHMQLDAQASIGNRSGRDWRHVEVALIAGTVNLDGGHDARPVMMRMSLAKAASDTLPGQSSLDAYRRYQLPSAVDLPDQSITQLPLYPPQTLACQRSIEVDLGPSVTGRTHPALELLPVNTTPDVDSRLQFTAPENLPAGRIQVKTTDSQGVLQLLGSSRLDDTASGQPVELTLGRSFLLTARQQRLGSRLERAHQQFDEQFEVRVDNAGNAPASVQIIAHPQRWSHWTIIASNAYARQEGPQQVRFQVKVPAQGHAVLHYTIRYQWQPGDLPASDGVD
ncbi:DUF4139 domain-containing protein [Frateuria aurantia]